MARCRAATGIPTTGIHIFRASIAWPSDIELIPDLAGLPGESGDSDIIPCGDDQYTDRHGQLGKVPPARASLRVMDKDGSG